QRSTEMRGASGVHAGAFLVWLARRHGRHNPFTILHLLLAAAAAASARGEEPGSWLGVVRGLWFGR
ncbi:MAG: hypothetical protein H0X38_18365, partial [Planctomycetes bacterium]|nr:hypothetical protein [Planctomycetota bacterium]